MYKTDVMTRYNYASGAPWEDRVGYSRAVKVGNTIEVTGTVALNEHNEVVGAGDAYAQTKFILEKIAKLESKKIQHQNWSLFARNRWDLDAKLLRAQINQDCVTAECNLGLVEFNAGLPVRHRLLIGMDEEMVFDLKT